MDFFCGSIAAEKVRLQLSGYFWSVRCKKDFKCFVGVLPLLVEFYAKLFLNVESDMAEDAEMVGSIKTISMKIAAVSLWRSIHG